jgi:tetratricopeptide (TPR) repeat protein
MIERMSCAGVALFACLLSAPGSAQVESPAPAPRAAVRAALGEARGLAALARRQMGPARSRALEQAAAAYDRCVARFEATPAVAAFAAWSAAELWRRHGSMLLAEKDYLHAARWDPRRYGQRGLLGAADMQRRQRRPEDARKTYREAERIDPRTGYAHRARLWLARMLQADGELDRAIEGYQAALESAPTPRRAVEVADLLAKAWIAKGDLESAGFVLEHVEQLVRDAGSQNDRESEWLRRASREMPARKALQRALDKVRDAGGDAVRLDDHLRRRRLQAALASGAC